MAELITVNGVQDFMGHTIPVVLGGFGPDAKCVTDKTVAEVHDTLEREIRRRINDNIARFRNGVDYLDLKNLPDVLASGGTASERVGQGHTLSVLDMLGYSKQAVTQANHIYLLSERGYGKLVKIMDTDQAWDVYEHLLDEYFEYRAAAQQPPKPDFDTSNLSPELQLMQSMLDQLVRHDLELKRQSTELERQAEEVKAIGSSFDDIKNVVSTNTSNWRTSCKAMINKMAQSLDGSPEAYRTVYTDIYDQVNERGNYLLERRLKNKRDRLTKAGATKAQVDNISMLDVIGEDKRLTEIFTAIVKEMAVKFNILPVQMSI